MSRYTIYYYQYLIAVNCSISESISKRTCAQADVHNLDSTTDDDSIAATLKLVDCPLQRGAISSSQLCGGEFEDGDEAVTFTDADVVTLTLCVLFALVSLDRADSDDDEHMASLCPEHMRGLDAYRLLVSPASSPGLRFVDTALSRLLVALFTRYHRRYNDSHLFTDFVGSLTPIFSSSHYASAGKRDYLLSVVTVVRDAYRHCSGYVRRDVVTFLFHRSPLLRVDNFPDEIDDFTRVLDEIVELSNEIGAAAGEFSHLKSRIFEGLIDNMGESYEERDLLKRKVLLGRLIYDLKYSERLDWNNMVDKLLANNCCTPNLNYNHFTMEDSEGLANNVNYDNGDNDTCAGDLNHVSNYDESIREKNAINSLKITLFCVSLRCLVAPDFDYSFIANLKSKILKSKIHNCEELFEHFELNTIYYSEPLREALLNLVIGLLRVLKENIDQLQDTITRSCLRLLPFLSRKGDTLANDILSEYTRTAHHRAQALHSLSSIFTKYGTGYIFHIYYYYYYQI